MARGRVEVLDRLQWTHTAQLGAWVINTSWRAPKRWIEPRELNPYSEKGRKKMQVEEFADLSDRDKAAVRAAFMRR